MCILVGIRLGKMLLSDKSRLPLWPEILSFMLSNVLVWLPYSHLVMHNDDVAVRL